MRPNVGDPRRMSRKKSTSRPWTQRTSFPMYGFHWKCSPRRTTAFDQLSFIWRKGTFRRNSSSDRESTSPRRNGSEKYPRSSANRAKRTTFTSGMTSGVTDRTFMRAGGSLSQTSNGGPRSEASASGHDDGNGVRFGAGAGGIERHDRDDVGAARGGH